MSDVDEASPVKSSSTLHYQWNSNTKARQEELAKLGVDITPKALSPAVSSPQPAAPAAGSAWNAAGTWEEKDVSAKATSLLREHLLAARKELDGSGLVIAIVSCSQLTGSAHFVFTRGKKRVGYEYEITMNWELQDAAGVAGAKGTLQLEEVSDSDSDVFSGYKVTLSSAAAEGGYAGKSLAAGDATGLVKRCEDHFRNVIKQWAEAVKSS